MNAKEAFDRAIHMALNESRESGLRYCILSPIISTLTVGHSCVFPCVRIDYMMEIERQQIILTVYADGSIYHGDVK